ncbi:SGNH/GDSL hydrolase family protein [uncultured Jatrophihabitans sp.]|uniref:SGNH/GDSL hydrolase family protein n=1 Tax=uncultured Jatrophihabitans sp. TaxID=1610747 RepID=UPI0035C9A167
MKTDGGVVIGDSFARGTGSSDGVGYPILLGRRLDCRIRVVAAGGCGFVNTGRWGPHRRRRWLVPKTAEFLLIQSSANDRRSPDQAIEQAMNDYLDRLHFSARVIITGAIWCGQDERNLLHRVTAVAQSVASVRGVEFIDTREWHLEPSLFHEDGHPTDDGHDAIAEMLADSIETTITRT